MKDAVGRSIGVADETGTVVSCTELGRIGDVISGGISEVFSADALIASSTNAIAPAAVFFWELLIFSSLMF